MIRIGDTYLDLDQVRMIRPAGRNRVRIWFKGRSRPITEKASIEQVRDTLFREGRLKVL